MSLLRGEDCVIGVGLEAVRNSAVAPQVWVPGRTPSGIKPVLDKVLVKETRGTKIASNASEIVQERAEGNLEFNVRSESFGYFIKPLVGELESALEDGETEVYRHTGSVLLEDPEHPTISIGLHQPNIQDYVYNGALVSPLEIKINPSDLVIATAGFMAKKETEKSPAYVPAFASNDYYFRQQDVKIYLADALDELDAAEPISVKDLSFNIANGAKPDQNISELNPNIIAAMMSAGIQMTLDLKNTDNHDIFVAGTYKAMRIKMERSDITIGLGSSPSIQFDYARVSFEGWDPDRPLEDIVKQKITATPHYSADDSKAFDIQIVNTTAEYAAADES